MFRAMNNKIEDRAADANFPRWANLFPYVRSRGSSQVGRWSQHDSAPGILF